MCLFWLPRNSERIRTKFAVFYNNNQTALTGPQIRVAWTVFAEAYQVEASQAKLHCRRFSVASFLSCMNNSEFVAVRGDAMLPAPAAVQIAATVDT